MKYFQKIAEGLDVTLLNAQIDAHPELWNDIPFRKYASSSPHAQMDDIWIRYNDVNPHLVSGDFSSINDVHFPVFYRGWSCLTALHPIVRGLIALVYGNHLGGIIITKIPPNGIIKPHVDKGWHVDFYDKFYLSLRPNYPAEYLRCGDEVLIPTPGSIWRFDNRLEHSVQNNSDEDRVTCIICIQTEMFRS